VIAHRPADEWDMRFVVHSWVSSWQKSDTAGGIQAHNWYRIMIPEVLEIIDKPEVKVAVAYESSDSDRGADLYGFIAADPDDDPPLVYYVYVKEPYRRSGIARGLFGALGINPQLPFNYAQSTPALYKFRRGIPMARFTPTLGRYLKSERRQGK
jgi:hypothetical protein